MEVHYGWRFIFRESHHSPGYSIYFHYFGCEMRTPGEVEAEINSTVKAGFKFYEIRNLWTEYFLSKLKENLDEQQISKQKDCRSTGEGLPETEYQGVADEA